MPNLGNLASQGSIHTYELDFNSFNRTSVNYMSYLAILESGIFYQFVPFLKTYDG